MKAMIVGAGKLGYRLAESMVFENIDVTVVDKRATPLHHINENYDILTVQANGLEMSVMEELDISTYDMLIATTYSDESNMLICTLAKKMGCKKVICRIRNPEHLEQLKLIRETMDIDVLVNPDLETARVITNYLNKDYSLHTGGFARGEIQFEDFFIGVHPEFVGKRVMDIPAFKPIVLAAISRESETIIPNGKTVILKDDAIQVVGKKADVEEFSKYFMANVHHDKVKSAVIMGGGKLGYYLAKELLYEDVSVVVIEMDKARAEELSAHIPEALVIHGDGTDVGLLETENLFTADVFIGTTGMDEVNILMSIVAKNHGIPRSICKVSRQNYVKIIDRLDVDATFNPTYITASNILKMTKGGRVVSVSLLLGGDAEATELIISPNSPYIDRPLKDLNLPEGMLIGAIISESKVIVPNGDSVLKANDRAVIFCLNKNLPNLRLFFEPRKKGVIGEFFNKS